MMVREREIESKLVQLVKAAGGECIKWVAPGTAGVPDRIVLLPGGIVAFVELKTSTGIVRAQQAHWHKRLKDLGFRCYIIRTREDIVFLLMDVLEIRVNRIPMDELARLNQVIGKETDE